MGVLANENHDDRQQQHRHHFHTIPYAPNHANFQAQSTAGHPGRRDATGRILLSPSLLKLEARVDWHFDTEHSRRQDWLNILPK